MTENTSEPELLPHHEQLDLCTSRLPYRQGRKLTAVKVSLYFIYLYHNNSVLTVITTNCIYRKTINKCKKSS